MEVIGTQRGLNQDEKVRLLKEKLRFLLRNPDHVYRVSSKEETEVGRAYSDEAVDVGEALCALGLCTPRQRRVLELWLGPKRPTQAQVALRLRVSVVTVKRDAKEALERMVAQVWDED